MVVNTSMDNAQSTVQLESNKNQNEVNKEKLSDQVSLLCGKPIKCYDYMTRPCIRKRGHTDGCNPFSDYYPQKGVEI